VAVGLTLAVVITVVTSIFVAAVIVLTVGYLIVMLLERRRGLLTGENVGNAIEAEYRSAIRAMNEAAGQPWRNVLD
jgi:hypothetical protein